MIELLLWPAVAGLVLAGIHAWFGQHVLARGVIFVDLSLAQMAALGLAVAVLMGHGVNEAAATWYALGFAAAGAFLFAAVRPIERAIPQEAIIGIVYAVSAAVVVLVLDRAPQGTEQVKQLLVGSLLAVTARDVAELALLYGAVGAVHVALRRPLMAASFAPGTVRPSRLLAWDLVFYGSFAVVVTSSVRIAGVLLVFSYLIVPAVLATLLARTPLARLAIGWSAGAGVTLMGLLVSWYADLPTGPAIVAVFGAAAAFAGVIALFRRVRGHAILGGVAVLVAIAGAALLFFPRMDHPWLDAVEAVALPLRTVFLDEGERATHGEVLQSMARDRAEIERLQALEQDVRWGRTRLEPEKEARLRQYLAGRGEISSGDALVLRHLRGKARERQRYGLGIPLLVAGGWAFVRLRSRARMRARFTLNHHKPW